MTKPFTWKNGGLNFDLVICMVEHKSTLYKKSQKGTEKEN